MSFSIDVSHDFGTRKVGCQLEAQDGIVALFGPSGAGKTSVLRMVAGLLRPDRGRIVVGDICLFDSMAGIDLRPDRRRCGYIFQDARLFPHMRVRANLRYARPPRDAGPPPLPFDELVDLLGIGALLDRWPGSLSGGEAQRVAIGRALLSQPHFFLMDEPLASLDEGRRDDIAAAIKALHARTAIPILYVSHDRRELDALTRTIVPIG